MKKTRRSKNQRRPRLFLSYAHCGKELGRWLSKLKADLEKGGVDVLLDLSDSKPGSSITQFTREIPTCEAVGIVCTPLYVGKLATPTSRVKEEYQEATRWSEKSKSGLQMLVLHKEGTREEAIPTALQNNVSFNFKTEKAYQESLTNLVSHMRQKDVQSRLKIGTNQAPKSTKLPTPSANNSGIPHDGILIVGDIENFTALDEPTQKEALHSLWQFLQKRLPEFIDKADPKHPIVPEVNATLDGIIITWPRPSLFNQWLDLAMDWINTVKGCCGLRVGFHYGRYQLLTHPVFEMRRMGQAYYSAKMIVGSGPNICQRVAGIGDAGHVVLSEEFFKEWQSEVTIQEAHDRVLPGWRKDNSPDSPMVMTLKQDEPQGIRLLRPPVTTEEENDKCWGDPPVPRRVINRESVHKQLVRLMLSVARETVALFDIITDRLYNESETELKKYQKRLEFSNLKPRVSIFRPVQIHLKGGTREEILRPSDYRFEVERDTTLEKALEEIAKGRERYGDAKRGTEYATAKDGEGPVGRAYNRDSTAFALPHLPKDPKKYKAILINETGLIPGKVDEMNKKALSFICFRLSLENTGDAGIAAVVCLDFMDNLNFIDRDAFQFAANQVMEKFSGYMAACWRLRQ